MRINPNTGTSVPTKPVEIPQTNWGKPVTAVEGNNKGGEKAVVTFVGDGDSASLKRSDGSGVVCRIDTIDAPERANPKYGKPGQPYGEEAKQKLEQMILNKEVTLKITRPTNAKNYDRALCQIEIEGVGVDRKMIQDGAAWLYRRYANNPELSALEDDAKKNKRGLWANPNPVYPEIFRRSLGK